MVCRLYVRLTSPIQISGRAHGVNEHISQRQCSNSLYASVPEVRQESGIHRPSRLIFCLVSLPKVQRAIPCHSDLCSSLTETKHHAQDSESAGRSCRPHEKHPCVESLQSR